MRGDDGWKGKKMSKECIEREAAKRALRIWITGCVLNGDNESADRFRDCIDMLDSLDAADVAPVRHGRWEDWWPGIGLIMTGEEMLYRCSVCDAKYSTVENKYCPNCGAKMDGEEKR